MKFNWFYIKAVLLVVLVAFLFGFAEKRNNTRKLKEIAIQFNENENLYVTEQAVNKLLIQNNVDVASVEKETLDLNRVEAILDAHDMIDKAQVYLTVDGRLKVQISQRKPIARIVEPQAFYLDMSGKSMPLSSYYSARVPVISGVNEDQLEEVFPLVDYIKNDDFLTRHITGISRLQNGAYELELRKIDFKVYFGKPNEIEHKFNNFKAFYKKALKDEKLDTYNMVNLQFGNQVVCTKK